MKGAGEFKFAPQAAWSDDFGWISFNCAEGDVGAGDRCDTSSYRVALPTNLKGWAWADMGKCNGGSNNGAICSSNSDCDSGLCDFNNDGRVDEFDYAIFALQWLEGCF